MTLPRRTFVHLTVGTVALPAISHFAWAQTDPSLPTRIIVGFAPGSSADIVARLIAQSLSEYLDRKFIVDNRPGAGGNLATETVVNAVPDGHTLLLTGPSAAISTTLYEKPAFDVRRDIMPVAAIAHCPSVMLVGPSLAATTVSEFIAVAKADPGKLAMASAGVGSASHLTGELFKIMNGVEMVHVAYRGGAGAYADLIAGRVDVYFPALVSGLGYIQGSGLRVLRHAANTWFGICAPRNTPTGVINRLNRDINAVLTDTNLGTRLADFGGTLMAGSSADFGRLIARQTAEWAKVIRHSGSILS
jgi:tripartite-type tricarboxylate transporter receptor subunit TctC